MNSKLAQPAGSSPGRGPLTIQQTIDLAKQHHTAGCLSEAEGLYQQVLQADPNQPVALHLLGVIAHQAGKNDSAVDLITKALAIKPDYAEAHSNLGIALTELGKLDEAVASYHKALAIKPDDARMHNNLGNALKNHGKLDEAVASYHKAPAITPDRADTHNNLGGALKDQGKLDEAVASYHKAIAIAPDYSEAHNNLGTVLKDLEKLDDAVASYLRALAIAPDYAEAHGNLGGVYQEMGKLDAAITCQRRAIALNPQNELFWSGLAVSLEAFSFTTVDDDLWQDLLSLLERPAVRPSHIIRPIISALRHDPNILQILDLAGAANPVVGSAYGVVAEQLSAIPLFLRIMGLNPIPDLQVERMLTVLRRGMIRETMAGKADEKGLPFSAALALQCFTNEYIYPETDEEQASVNELQKQIAALVEQELNVPPALVAALGAYRPLHGFSWARELNEREWPGSIKAVIERQLSEPQREQSLRSQISRLTPIENTVSEAVREQYEENPYPRWINTGIRDKGRSIGAELRGAPLRLDLGDYESPENPEILVAGCGTGQHALTTASRFSNARLLAVDLSLSSLTYARRMTEDHEFSNIEYAQADIMELGTLGRRFDLIECSGVLHHLGDPVAGWRVLVDLLQPGGLMKIGLYSETGRQDIIRGRALIAEQGYTTSAEDIRRCRQDIIAMAEGGNRKMADICNGNDFYGLSECRDLLFHVQEHRFTLPQIEAALESLELKFLGFEVRDEKLLGKFKQSHPNNNDFTSLPLWHQFELENPNMFRGMYQFWCQKK